MKRLIITVWLTVLLFLPLTSAEKVCTVYFTGIGCPHCAKTDPVLLGEIPREYPDFVLIEYEIYHQREKNANLMLLYDSKYHSGFGVPLLIFNDTFRIIGDLPILQNIKKTLDTIHQNPCPLLDGMKRFENVDINSLPGLPKIWTDQRILIKYEEKGNVDNTILHKLLTEKNITSVLMNISYLSISPLPVTISGNEIRFEHAVKIGNWIFEWNGEDIPETNTTLQQETSHPQETVEKRNIPRLEKIISLALVDSINPCALAVLTLILIAILTYDPKQKRKVLFTGLAFTISVFSLYLIYGLIIIKFFQVIQTLTSLRLFLYKLLAIFAIILGILNAKDFLYYRPGGFLTEMPLSLRPKVKKLINSVTSPGGAFIIGIFVTLFLLPCTIGPYVIAGGILSVLEILETLPWLLIYNFIFVLPMIMITLIVYLGIAKIEDISGWKERNIRYLHLLAGIIMLSLGVSMFFGWI